MKIGDVVYWFYGDVLDYIQVYFGEIEAITKEGYQIFSSNKPLFIEKTRGEVFSEKQIKNRLKQKRREWAEQYIEESKRLAHGKATASVVIGYETRKHIKDME